MRMKCVNKVRDSKGNIRVYQVVGEDGSKHEVTGQQIKDAIQSGQHVFVNLQIDKAGRLVDKAEPKAKENTEEKLNKAIHKLGLKMQDGTCVKVMADYDICYIDFSVEVSPIIIDFLKTKAQPGMEYIKKQLITQFNRDLYQIQGMGTYPDVYCFEKEKLMFRPNPNDIPTYHVMHYTLEDVKKHPEFSDRMCPETMDSSYPIIDGCIKYVKTESEKEEENLITEMETSKIPLEKLGVKPQQLLGETHYNGIDFKNHWFGQRKYSWEKELVLPDKFIMDKEKVKLKMNDDTLTEILTCRAANKYKMVSNYIKALTAEQKKEASDLANWFKTNAEKYDFDPVKAVFNIMDSWCTDFAYDWTKDVMILTEPFLDDGEGECIPVDSFTYWIQIAENLWFCWE